MAKQAAVFFRGGGKDTPLPSPRINDRVKPQPSSLEDCPWSLPQLKLSSQTGGDGPVANVLIAQPWEPKFESPAHTLKKKKRTNQPDCPCHASDGEAEREGSLVLRGHIILRCP